MEGEESYAVTSRRRGGRRIAGTPRTRRLTGYGVRQPCCRFCRRERSSRLACTDAPEAALHGRKSRPGGIPHSTTSRPAFSAVGRHPKPRHYAFAFGCGVRARFGQAARGALPRSRRVEEYAILTWTAGPLSGLSYGYPTTGAQAPVAGTGSFTITVSF